MKFCSELNEKNELVIREFSTGNQIGKFVFEDFQLLGWRWQQEQDAVFVFVFFKCVKTDTETKKLWKAANNGS